MESNSKLVLFLNLKTKFPSKAPEPHLDHFNYFTPYMLFQLLQMFVHSAQKPATE